MRTATCSPKRCTRARATSRRSRKRMREGRPVSESWVAMWRMYAIYAPDKLAVLRRGVQEELTRLLEQGITEAELVDAKKSLLEQRKLNRAQDGSLASALLSQIATGRTMAFSAGLDTAIAAVSLDTVNAALRRYLSPGRLLQVYAGDFAKYGVQSIAP